MTGTEIHEEVQEATNPEDQVETEKPEAGTGEQLTDKHGQEAISKGKYARDIAAKDAEIAELRKQVEAAAESKEGRKELEDKISELESRIASEKIDHSLDKAGCINVKAAKALLDDYEGDIAKLKESCPYLFKEEQKGSTGLVPKGTPSSALKDKINKAMKV